MTALLIAAALIGLIPAFIAKGKGKSFLLWWLYGAALFIAALPHSLLIKPDSKTQEAASLADSGKKCSYCAEVVKIEAKVCRYCHRELLPKPDPIESISLTDKRLLMELHGITYSDFRFHLRGRRFMTLGEAVEHASISAGT